MLALMLYVAIFMAICAVLGTAYCWFDLRLLRQAEKRLLAERLRRERLLASYWRIPCDEEETQDQEERGR